MKTTRRPLPLAGFLAMAGLLGAAPREASAQAPVYPTQGVYAPAGRVLTGPAYVVAPAPVVTSAQTYVVPGRPVYRVERRFFAFRPNYAGRPQLSFAPYSDAYPKTQPLRPTYYPAAPR